MHGFWAAFWPEKIAEKEGAESQDEATCAPLGLCAWGLLCGMVCVPRTLGLVELGLCAEDRTIYLPKKKSPSRGPDFSLIIFSN